MKLLFVIIAVISSSIAGVGMATVIGARKPPLSATTAAPLSDATPRSDHSVEKSKIDVVLTRPEPVATVLPSAIDDEGDGGKVVLTGGEEPSGRVPASDSVPSIKMLMDAMETLGKLQTTAPPDLGPNRAGEEAEAKVERLPQPEERDTSSSRPDIAPVIESEGDDRLSIHIKDTDIREVLELLSEQGKLNILASNSVTGKVSASLNGVSVDTALEAILRSTGYVSRHEGKFIYVGTPEDFQSLRTRLDRISTRVYRPNYVTSAELQSLLTPLLSPTGKISVTSPAAQGIGSDGNAAGGNAYANGEALVIQDYEGILAEIDQIIREVDCQPLQVAIEAMILSVKLDDEHKFGVDFQLLRDQNNVRFGTGSPRQAPLAGGGQVDATTGARVGEFDLTGGGVKFAFLDSNIGVFVEALETIGDTNVIATPRLLCLNKQRAEILIGAQLGYISTTLTETSAAQNVEFLEVGTQLRIRPFISNDGMVRMEVHPELSQGSVSVQDGFTLPDKEVTQVTTNIMAHDGCTVILGGLMREDLTTTTNQVPLFGSLPVVGFLFRNKTEGISRQEYLVLLTPRIVRQEVAAEEGTEGAYAFHRRQAAYVEKMAPGSRVSLGRKYMARAQAALAEGDLPRALKFIELAWRFDPNNREIGQLRDEWNGFGAPANAECEVEPEEPTQTRSGKDPSTVTPWMLQDLAEGPSLLAPVGADDDASNGESSKSAQKNSRGKRNVRN